MLTVNETRDEGVRLSIIDLDIDVSDKMGDVYTYQRLAILSDNELETLIKGKDMLFIILTEANKDGVSLMNKILKIGETYNIFSVLMENKGLLQELYTRYKRNECGMNTFELNKRAVYGVVESIKNVISINSVIGIDYHDVVSILNNGMSDILIERFYSFDPDDVDGLFNSLKSKNAFACVKNALIVFECKAVFIYDLNQIIEKFQETFKNLENIIYGVVVSPEMTSNKITVFTNDGA